MASRGEIPNRDGAFNSIVCKQSLFVRNKVTANRVCALIASIGSIDTELLISGNVTISGDLHVNNLFVSGDTILDGGVIVTGDTTLEQNLFVSGGVEVGGNVTVDGGLKVSGDVSLCSGVQVGQNVTVGGDLTVEGSTILQSGLLVSGNATVDGDLKVQGNTTLCNNVFISGDSVLNNNLFVCGSATINTDFKVIGDTTLCGNLFLESGLIISGDTTLQGNLKVDNNLCVSGNSTLQGDLVVSGDTTLQGNLCVSGQTKLQQLVVNNSATLSNTVVNGNLKVSGSTSLCGPLQVNGSSTLQGTLKVANGTSLCSNLNVSGDTIVKGDTRLQDLKVLGATTLCGSVFVSGPVDLNNLKVNGNVTICQDLFVSGNTTLQSAVKVCDDLLVTGDTTLQQTLKVEGNASLCSNLQVSGDLRVDGNTALQGNLTVAGSSTLQDTTVEGQFKTTNGASLCAGAQVNTTLTVNGRSDLTDLNVTGQTTLASNVFIGGSTTIDDSLRVNGLLCAASTLAVDFMEPKTGSVVTLGASGDSFCVDRISTRFIDGKFGGSVTIATGVNVLGDLTATGKVTAPHFCATLPDSVVKTNRLLPKPDNVTLTIGALGDIVVINTTLDAPFLCVDSLTTDLISPKTGPSMDFGTGGQSFVFNDSIKARGLVQVNTIVPNTGSVVTVNPNLCVSEYTQTKSIRAKNTSNSITLERSDGTARAAINIGASGTEVTTVAGSGLTLSPASGLVCVNNTLQAQGIEPKPGGSLALCAQDIQTDRIESKTNNTLAFADMSSTKRAQFNLAGPGAILQALGGPLHLSAAGGDGVTIQDTLETQNILPDGNLTRDIATPTERYRNMFTGTLNASTCVVTPKVRSPVTSGLTLIASSGELELNRMGSGGIRLFAGSGSTLTIESGSTTLFLPTDVCVSGTLAVGNAIIPKQGQSLTVCADAIVTDLIRGKSDSVIEVQNDSGTNLLELDLSTADPLVRALGGGDLRLDAAGAGLVCVEATTKTELIRPDADGTRDIGTSGLRYNEVFTNIVDADRRVITPNIESSSGPITISPGDGTLIVDQDVCVLGDLRVDEIVGKTSAGVSICATLVQTNCIKLKSGISLSFKDASGVTFMSLSDTGTESMITAVGNPLQLQTNPSGIIHLDKDGGPGSLLIDTVGPRNLTLNAGGFLRLGAGFGVVRVTDDLCVEGTLSVDNIHPKSATLISVGRIGDVVCVQEKLQVNQIGPKPGGSLTLCANLLQTDDIEAKTGDSILLSNSSSVNHGRIDMGSTGLTLSSVIGNLELRGATDLVVTPGDLCVGQTLITDAVAAKTGDTIQLYPDSGGSRLSVQLGSGAAASTLATNQGQNLGLQAPTVVTSNDLCVNGNLEVNTWLPKSGSSATFGSGGMTLRVRDFLCVDGTLAVNDIRPKPGGSLTICANAIQTDVISAKTGSVISVTDDLCLDTLVATDNIRAKTMVTETVNFETSSGTDRLDIDMSGLDTVIRSLGASSTLVLEAGNSTVAVNDDLCVTGKLQVDLIEPKTAAGLTLCANAVVTDVLDAKTGSTICVNPTLQLVDIQVKSGANLEFLDSSGTRQLRIDLATDQQPLIQARGTDSTLRLNAQGSTVAVLDTLQTQNIVPDSTAGTRNIGSTVRPFNALFVDNRIENPLATAPLELMAESSTISLDGPALSDLLLDTAGDHQLTIKSRGALNDLILTAGSSLVVVNDDLCVNGDLRVGGQILPKLGQDLTICADLLQTDEIESKASGGNGTICMSATLQVDKIQNKTSAGITIENTSANGLIRLQHLTSGNIVGGDTSNGLVGTAGSLNRNVVLGGDTNVILQTSAATNNNFIGGGNNHTITNDSCSAIVGGTGHYTDNNDNFLGGGSSNTLCNANAAICGGSSNKVGNTCLRSSIFGGNSNRIGSLSSNTNNDDCAILGGCQNVISGTGGNGNDNHVICGGFNNIISGPPDTNRGIFAGSGNSITDGDDNVVVGGINNRVTADNAGVFASSGCTAAGGAIMGSLSSLVGAGGAVVGGTRNTALSLNSGIFGSQDCTVAVTAIGSVIAGCIESSVLTGGAYSGMLASQDSTIAGDRVAIVGSNQCCMGATALRGGILGSNQSRIDGDESAIVASMASRINTASTNGGVMASIDCTLNANRQLIGASQRCLGDTGGVLSAVLASRDSTITGDRSVVLASTRSRSDSSAVNSGIMGTQDCTIDGDRSGIVGSASSVINLSATESAILGADCCKIKSSTGRNAVVGSFESIINASGGENVIAGGQGNLIADSGNESGIFAGCDNTIRGTSNESGIFAGDNNSISDSNHSGILAGQDNRIDDCVAAKIMGSGCTVCADHGVCIGRFAVVDDQSSIVINAHDSAVQTLTSNDVERIHMDADNDIHVFCDIDMNGNCVINTSDQKKKEAIEDLELGLDHVLQMQPRQFYFKDKNYSVLGEGKRTGFIAQELETIDTNLVIRESNRKRRVAYRNRVASLQDKTPLAEELYNQDTPDAQEGYAVDYAAFIPILANAIKQEHSLSYVPEAANNAAAAAEGVPVGGYYRLPGDPAQLCMRTA